MKPETVMWLLPVMFMFHDFEEIIMMNAWGRRYAALLDERMPAGLRKLSRSTLNLSTAGFAFAVMLIFLSLSAATYACVDGGFLTVWTGMLVVYFVHLVIHLLQGLYLKKYVPAVITSILTGLYCLYALWYAGTVMAVDWLQVGRAILIGILPAAGLFVLYIRLANRFDRWLKRYGQQN